MLLVRNESTRDLSRGKNAAPIAISSRSVSVSDCLRHGSREPEASKRRTH
jgi:hypothetical protein